mmetsp:Transcript_57164/g.121374  ORF Transcript_57164/g.121374 Transcript_57164/m.121374 type:complete len:212 (+) Transcript_57164:1585-2220(+)
MICSHNINDKTTPIAEARNKLPISALGPEGLAPKPIFKLCKTNDRNASIASERNTAVALLDSKWSNDPFWSIQYTTSAANADIAHKIPTAPPNAESLQRGVSLRTLLHASPVRKFIAKTARANENTSSINQYSILFSLRSRVSLFSPSEPTSVPMELGLMLPTFPARTVGSLLPALLPRDAQLARGGASSTPRLRTPLFFVGEAMSNAPIK